MSLSDYLAVSSYATNFLGRHTRVSKALGGSADRTEKFSTADTNDRKNSSLKGEWYGLAKEGFYNPSPIEEFTGILEPYNSNFSIDDVDLDTHEHNPNAIEVDAARNKNPYDKALLGDDLIFGQLYGEDGSELREVMIEDDELREKFVNNNGNYDYLTERDLAYLANEITPPADIEDWLKSGDLSRMTVEDRSQLVDKLNESEELVDLLSANPREELLSRSRERVLDELTPLLENTGDILDEEFLSEHPLFSLHILQDPAYLKWVEEDRDNAKAARRDAENIENVKREELAEIAESEVGQLPYTESWFNDNIDFAEIVVNDSEIDHDSQLGQWLNQNGNILPENASVTDLTNQYWSDTAFEKVEESVDQHLFDNSTALSMMSVLDENVAQSIINDSEKISLSFPNVSIPEKEAFAVLSYGLGLGHRVYGDYQRIV
jgi:hypothetical protein